jgi:hypothetical protein
MARLFWSFTVLVVCIAVIGLAGCGKREEPSPQQSGESSTAQPSAPADFAQMAAQNAETLKTMNQGKDVQPVSLDGLKAFLPEALAGMKRTDSDAQHVNMMGINTASANADYQAGSGAGALELTITDVGNVSGPMRMGLTGWAVAQFDRQTDTGYEKTTTCQGYKAFEEYDRQDQSGGLRAFVAERFVVEVTGDGVTMETIKKAMGQVDLKKIAQAAK